MSRCTLVSEYLMQFICIFLFIGGFRYNSSFSKAEEGVNEVVRREQGRVNPEESR